jgi:hypothetical protein
LNLNHHKCIHSCTSSATRWPFRCANPFTKTISASGLLPLQWIPPGNANARRARRVRLPHPSGSITQSPLFLRLPHSKAWVARYPTSIYLLQVPFWHHPHTPRLCHRNSPPHIHPLSQRHPHRKRKRSAASAPRFLPQHQAHPSAAYRRRLFFCSLLSHPPRSPFLSW